VSSILGCETSLRVAQWGYSMRFSLGPTLGFALVLCPMANTQAAELQVLAGGGIAEPVKVLAAQFEQASGHKLTIRFGTTPELIKMAAAGPFDLGVVPQDVFQDAPTRSRFDPAPAQTIARVGIGMAVRAGAPKPDIGTPEALKQTLLKARAIASIPASATGYLLAGIYEQLGIAEEMKAKTRAQPGPAQIAEAVASGEAELAVFLTNVLADPRLDLVGPFPREIQREVVYMAGVGGGSRQADAAKEFIAFLRSPTGATVIKSKAMNPG
jgi:molybdate transport system substrate-binding protein